MPKQGCEHHILKVVRTKLNENILMVTKADKSNSIVITPKNAYVNKICDYILSENLSTLSEEPRVQ